MNLFYVLLLGFAVSIDGFVAGAAYGLRNIRMPLCSLSTVGMVTVICTGTAMTAAYVLGQFVDSRLAIDAGALLLMAIGLFSLFQEYVTKGVGCYKAEGEVTARKLTFHVGRIVINIMSRPESADVDQSQRISPLEAVFLGLALGVDNMVAVFAAALMEQLPVYTPLLMGLVQIIFIAGGFYASSHFFPAAVKRRVPYLPGILLILLGFIRLV
ncbi:MAG: manganese efflux pump [Veillonellales bacterium]